MIIGTAVTVSLSVSLLSGRDEICAGKELSTVVAIAERVDHAVQDPERV
jgi:hypothetical protein